MFEIANPVLERWARTENVSLEGLNNSISRLSSNRSNRRGINIIVLGITALMAGCTGNGGDTLQTIDRTLVNAGRPVVEVLDRATGANEYGLCPNGSFPGVFGCIGQDRRQAEAPPSSPSPSNFKVCWNSWGTQRHIVSEDQPCPPGMK